MTDIPDKITVEQRDQVLDILGIKELNAASLYMNATEVRIELYVRDSNGDAIVSSDGFLTTNIGFKIEMETASE